MPRGDKTTIAQTHNARPFPDIYFNPTNDFFMNMRARVFMHLLICGWLYKLACARNLFLPLAHLGM
jgi:hypothetical protein